MLALPQDEVPTKDFVFLYTTDSFQLPSIISGRTDSSYSCVLSFIPQFCELSVSDAEKMAKEGKEEFEVSLDSARGEYLFLLDRSGSM